MAYTIKLTPPEPCGQSLNVWAQPDFMQAVSKLHKREAYHLKCYKGNQLIALLPIYEKRMLGYRALVCPSTSYYQGLNLWLEDSSLPGRKLLDSLQVIRQLAAYLQEHYKRIHFNLSPETIDVRGFTWEKLKAIPLFTFTYNYTDILSILPDEQKKLNRANQQGYRFAEELRLGEFMRLNKAMEDRKKRESSFSNRALEAFYLDLHQRGILRQYNLYLEDRIVSSNILLKDGTGKAYTVLRATEEEALKNGASTLHTISLIESLRPELSELDFCGANVPEVARFKAALGLKLKVFYHIHT